MDNKNPSATGELSPEKRELLAYLLEEEGIIRSPAQKISPRDNPDEPVSLSFAQQRMWLLNQLEPHSAAYNEPMAVRLMGALNIAALEQSLGEIARRHQILRTIFTTVEGEPVQIIRDTIDLALPVVDLRTLPEHEPEARLPKLAQEEFQQLFDLAQGPLIRVKLFRMAEEDHVFLLTMHHTISDGWSMGVFFEELARLYGDFSAGKPSPLPALPIQYADFAHWQRQSLQSKTLAADLAYWKQKLGGSLPTLEFPTDHPRPPRQTFRGARHYLSLPQPLSEALKALSRREGATLFMTLLAAFQTLLHRYTSQDDILVGSPIAGRNRPEVEELLGCFLNPLALRTDLSGNPSFRELLGRVREVALEAYAHQHLPFEYLVEELQPDRELSRNPLYQVMFVLQSPLMPELPGLSVQLLQLDRGAAPMDVILSLEDTRHGLRGWWEYNTDLFDATTIARLAGHFQTLLEGIVANPDQRLSDLPLLTEAERYQVLVAWNDTRRPYPRDACIHQLFEAQADARPEAVAVVDGELLLTYWQLNQQSNQLAHYLRGLGVAPNRPVAVCMERSAALVVAQLAILKAGGAYVPLDPDYPPQRLRFMLEDTQAAAVVTGYDRDAELTIKDIPLLRLGADGLVLDALPCTNPENCNIATDLACVIYTSGSTGRPKGVTVPHRGVVRLLFGVDYAPLDERQTYLLLAPTSFDASTFELWGPLLHGGTCVVYPHRVPDAHELERILREHRITVLWLTAALFNTVIDQWPQALASVPHLLIGGEALSVRHVRRGLEAMPCTQIVNGYGPTESTTFTCTYPIPCNLNSDARSIPIGRPIGNTRVYILDRYMNPIPVGVPGELYIAGDGLACGYLDCPELTAERFVVDPFSAETEARMYKTSDLCCWLPDGNVEFLGRCDHQVKIRGFRIELGEIETALGQHPAVREAVVLAREDTPGDRRLVAYLVSRPEQKLEIHELRSFLKEKLPEYMVPAAFMLLEALPLSPNGKADRQALPAPDATRPELEKAFVAPRDALESQLAKMWEKILGVQPVGVKDNFFELGGHSLIAVRLLAQMEKLSGKKLPLVTLFQAPTVEELASILRHETWIAPWSSLVAVQPNGSKPPFFCVHAAAGNILFYSDLGRYLGSDQPFYGLQAQGLDGDQDPYTRIEEMAAHYIKEIRSLQPEGPYMLGGLSLGGTLAYEMAQQLQAQGQKVALLVLFDTYGPGYPRTSLLRLIRDKTRRVATRIYNNLQSLMRLELKEQAAFAAEKTENVRKRTKIRIKKRIHKLKERIQTVVCNIYIRRGWPLPPPLRYLRVREADHEAHRKYVPKPYSGPVTLFRASRQPLGCYPDPKLGWGHLVNGDLEIHEIPGSHSHTLVREPHVRVVVEKLKPCLSRAQGMEVN